MPCGMENALLNDAALRHGAPADADAAEGVEFLSGTLAQVIFKLRWVENDILFALLVVLASGLFLLGVQHELLEERGIHVPHGLPNVGPRGHHRDPAGLWLEGEEGAATVLPSVEHHCQPVQGTRPRGREVQALVHASHHRVGGLRDDEAESPNHDAEVQDHGDDEENDQVGSANRRVHHPRFPRLRVIGLTKDAEHVLQSPRGENQRACDEDDVEVDAKARRQGVLGTHVRLADFVEDAEQNQDEELP
mmetsp:Transcript_5434/g.15185  ORF Transcript_5434/g.15185 Transcript_5434/m.15185 type:complete len:249 (+) Transcript_5434:88-834(+)